jgi:hypothetical protein
MKKLFALLVFAIASLPSAHAQSTNISKVLFTWDYNFGADVACTVSLTTNCISGYRLQEGSTVIATIPATSATNYTYTLAPLPSSGNHTYTLVATKVLQGGSTIDSAPATGSLQVPNTPNSPTTFSVSFQ